jgi:hypothetical protein
MGKEYSNKLRKRGINDLGKVVDDDILQHGRSPANTVQTTLTHFFH